LKNRRDYENTRVVHGAVGSPELQSKIAEVMPLMKERFSVVGGPPCQSFSTAGNVAGTDEPRGTEIATFWKTALALRPVTIVMEHVPNLLHPKFKPVVDMIYEMCASAGYIVDHTVVNATEFEGYTNRKRVLFFATNHKPMMDSGWGLFKFRNGRGRTFHEAVRGLETTT